MYKVIIVEDDKGMAEGICNCLADWGMEAAHSIFVNADWDDPEFIKDKEGMTAGDAAKMI